MKNTSYFPYAFFQGKIIPTDEAKVSIMTHALQYGTGIFGGIRGYVGDGAKDISLFRAHDHYKRFISALRILNEKIPYTEEQLVHITLDLARKNKPTTDCYFRPISYANRYGLSPDLHNLEFDFAMYMIPLDEYLSISKGLRLMISSWMRITDNMIPARAKITGGYINSSLAKGEAVRLGFDDALMMNSEGHITEGSSSNFFMVRDGVLITSPVCGDVLEGITRKSILKLANDLKIAVEEREIDRTEVYISDEAFLTGTGAQVAWISQVDGRTIGNGKIGPITSQMQTLFFDIVRGKEKKYAHWLTRV